MPRFPLVGLRSKTSLASKEHTVILPILLLITDLFWSSEERIIAVRRNWRLYLPTLCGGLLAASFPVSRSDQFKPQSTFHPDSCEMRFNTGMRRTAVVVMALSCACARAGQPSQPIQPPIWRTKFDVIQFEKVENGRLAAAQKAVDVITAFQGARNIENTLVPYDEALRQLSSARYFSGLIEMVHPDAHFRDRATAMTRKVSDSTRALSLNRAVYEALAALSLKGADAATRHYVERQLLQFRLAGVNQDEETRAKLRQLNDKLTQAQSTFERNIADGTKTVEAHLSELHGLPQDYLDRHKPGPDGKVRITTDDPDALPVLKFAKSDELRRRLYLALWTQAYPQNLEVLKEMMDTRYQTAKLLGYSSWADYNAADKMIGSGSNIGNFIREVEATARPLMQSVGVLDGSIGGPGWSLSLSGSINYGDPYSLRFQGKGMVGGEQWIYDYAGYAIKPWPNGVNQVPAIIGSVVWSVPHSSGTGTAPAGVVCSWIAVWQGPLS